MRTNGTKMHQCGAKIRLNGTKMRQYGAKMRQCGATIARNAPLAGETSIVRPQEVGPVVRGHGAGAMVKPHFCKNMSFPCRRELDPTIWPKRTQRKV